jgi:hypothetical protein
MARLCPICGSDKTGASPMSHKNYIPDRGRLDIDYNRCQACHGAWETHHYVREDVTEIKAVRRGDGNLLAWGHLPPPQCKHCQSLNVRWLYEEGRWRDPGVGILRYECNACGEIWQEMARDDDGRRVARRTWRAGRPNESQEDA